MRHKYLTDAFVLERSGLGEAGALVTLVTREVGLVRARTQGLRRSGAKLASALTTLGESRVTLVHGKDGWRISGAVLARSWFPELSRQARSRACRVAKLFARLAPAETVDERFFDILQTFLAGLHAQAEEKREAEELHASLALLAALGLDEGGAPASRAHAIARINRGIIASGL